MTIITSLYLNLSLPNKLSSAKFLVYLNFHGASMSLKAGENVFRVSNSLDLDETPSYSVSHPDPSCLHMVLWLCLACYGLLEEFQFLARRTDSRGSYCCTPGVRRQRLRQRRRPHLVKVSL